MVHLVRPVRHMMVHSVLAACQPFLSTHLLQGPVAKQQTQYLALWNGQVLMRNREVRALLAVLAAAW